MEHNNEAVIFLQLVYRDDTSFIQPSPYSRLRVQFNVTECPPRNKEFRLDSHQGRLLKFHTPI
jgi:hypothetical protein